MVEHLQFNLEPPLNWEEECNNRKSLLYKSAWYHVLEKGFKCQTLYAWDKDDNTGLTVSIFNAGPFRVGYLGFPIGGTVNKSLTTTLFQKLKRSYYSQRPHLIYIPVSAFIKDSDLIIHKATVTPETAITDLSVWDYNRIPKLRRDINKAARSNFELQSYPNKDSTKSIYQLYRNTVLRHSGNIRYTECYFNALLELSKRDSNVFYLSAFRKNRIAGFIISAIHLDTAYYLHGAVDPDLSKYGASDWLLYHAIKWAQDENVKCFNLMQSPYKQYGLIRYKEKFGAITKEHKTYEVVINPVMSYGFKKSIEVIKMKNEMKYKISKL